MIKIITIRIKGSTRKMILIETNGSVYGQLWFLSYTQLTAKFRSGFCARFLYQLLSAAVGLYWYKSSCVKSHVFGRCCSVQCGSVVFSSSPRWPCPATGPRDPPHHLLGHPLLSSSRGAWRLSRGSGTGKDLGVQLAVWRLAGLRSQHALKLST